MPFAPLLGPKEALIACMIDGPFSRGHKMATISRSDWMETPKKASAFSRPTPRACKMVPPVAPASFAAAIT